MDETDVTFRWKDRGIDGWRIERLPGVEFLRRFLQHVLPRGFHKVRYCGLWNRSKRELSNRAWVLLILTTPVDIAKPLKMIGFSDSLSGLTELTDHALEDVANHDAITPRCPHCGSCRTRFLGDYPRSGVPKSHKPTKLIHPMDHSRSQKGRGSARAARALSNFLPQSLAESPSAALGTLGTAIRLPTLPPSRGESPHPKGF
jgi:hypothetical protein